MKFFTVVCRVSEELYEGGMCKMAVSWMSGSDQPVARVNVAPGEEKSLCPLGL